MKKVTIRDVAKAAGVSYVTVSNVVNGKGQMTEKTRKKVLAMIKKMNFHPDTAARTLVSGKTNSIAFISEFLGSPFVTNVLTGVERQLFETNNSELNLTHNSTKGLKHKEEALINEMIYGQKADAVIMLTIRPSNAQIREFRKAGIPLVLIEGKPAPGASSISVDNYKGGYAAASYLISKGRKKICAIDWEQPAPEWGHKDNPGIKERLKGFAAALRDAGIEPDEGRIFKIRYFTTDEGSRAMSSILENKKDTDAVFCAAGDIVALGMIRRAKQAGVAVPGDMSFIGYDDVQMAEFSSPALTTVRQPLVLIGQKAMDMALDMMKGGSKGGNELLIIPELIVRESA